MLKRKYGNRSFLTRVEEREYTQATDKSEDYFSGYISLLKINKVTSPLFVEYGVVLPTGKNIEKDSDELETALLNGIIEQALYDLAWKEASSIIGRIKKDDMPLLSLSKNHRDILFGKRNS